MIYYKVNGWILPSEKEEKVLNQNLINQALLTLMMRDYEEDSEEEVNKKLQMALEEYLTKLPYEYPTLEWGMDEEPSKEQMEDFITQVLEKTEQGQSLLRARGQKMEPIPKDEYWEQEEMDGLTLSQMLMELPEPGTEADHGDNYSGWTNPYVD